jgi:hypothetical protein
MESLDYWRLCDELSVHQAALLIAGCDPSTESDYADAEGNPDGYEAAKTAISNALQRGAINGRFVPLYRYDFDGNCEKIEHSIDISNSRIEVDALRTWLARNSWRMRLFTRNKSCSPVRGGKRVTLNEDGSASVRKRRP